MSRFSPVETSVLTSPAWFLPFDDFARRARSVGVAVALDRWDPAANAWLPAEDVAPVRTPSAAIAFPDLGRRGGRGAPPRRYRARFAATGFQPLYPADGRPFTADLVGVEFVAPPYDDTHPPAAAAEPRLVRLLPSTAFDYPPGVRVVRGVVVDGASGSPVANALVEASGTAGLDAVPWLERTLTDSGGAFRLSLRWEGERVPGGAEVFVLRATERPGRAGSLSVRLPDERDRRHLIEIVDQQ
ncbi:carboxypeptidase regulatory-like domain-containing protein [Actinokineospora auranticolor]|uniref:Carboxypeptidase family protein n=1 Tax=Actinokineospora auranticolor TaxID=155976 RepID=A0A2S6GPN6_9PSEU|nr:hypothetical protein [Actinokineospora auranticolor]PPK67157.1 hypothetical protein CLV40_108154 [Actinokineospora auranticolor]